MANKSTSSLSHAFSSVPAALAALQCPQTAVSVVIVIVVAVVDSAFVVVLGKRVGLIRAPPTWMKTGVLTSIAFNSATCQMSTSVLSAFLWGI